MTSRRPIGLALLLLFVACTQASRAPASRPTPTIGEPPLQFAACASTPKHVTVIAKSFAFNRTCFSYAANTPVSIQFINRDVGVNHNIVFLPRPWGYNTPPKAALFGPIVKGPADVVYGARGLPAGLLFMVCYVHHDTMFGLVGVAPLVSPSSGSTADRFRIVWADETDAPRGYRWDVQIERPHAAGFTTWKTDLTGFGVDFVPDAGPGAYRFRVWQHHPPTGIIGYSPAASIAVQ